MRPYFIFRTLLLDSRYWRGLFAMDDDENGAPVAKTKPVLSSTHASITIGNNTTNNSSPRSTSNASSSSSNSSGRYSGGAPSSPGGSKVALRQPLMGTSLIHSAASSLAQQVDGLQVPMLYVSHS
jgi:hypothetical protein